MDIEIEFNYGPLQVKVDSSDDEDYDDVLDNVAEFINGNEDLFRHVTIDGKSSGDDAVDSPQHHQEDTDLSQFTNSEAPIQGSDTEEGNSDWNTIVNETGMSVEKLRHMFGVGDDVFPQILFGEELTEESNTEQMLRGTLMILAVWEDYYDNNSLRKDEITETLRKSGVHHENYHNVYQRSEFSTYCIRDDVPDEETGGETSEISLTPPGKTKAYELIEEYAEQIEV